MHKIIMQSNMSHAQVVWQAKHTSASCTRPKPVLDVTLSEFVEVNSPTVVVCGLVMVSRVTVVGIAVVAASVTVVKLAEKLHN